MIKVSRQVNLSAIRENGEKITLCREFKGVREIASSFFMSTLSIINRETKGLPSGKFFVVNRHSYFIFEKVA